MSCCLFKFNNLLIQCLDFSSPGYLLPIKHLIQGVTLLCFGLPTFQAKAGERGTENFVGINQAVELWGQIPAWFPWDCLAWRFFGCGSVLVGNLVAGKKKSRKVKEEVDKGRNLAQGKNRGAEVQCGKRGSSGVFKG